MDTDRDMKTQTEKKKRQDKDILTEPDSVFV